MDKFSTLTTGAVALEADNIDTDQIMPKQFLRGIDKAGLDKGLFYNLKHKADGSLNPDCVLNSSAAAKAAWLPVRISGVAPAASTLCGGCCKEAFVWWLRQASARSSTAIALTTDCWLAKLQQTTQKSSLPSFAPILRQVLRSILLHERSVRVMQS